jgi:hypothetical protein
MYQLPFLMEFFCRNASKSSGAPAQLTIFYAGSVSCFDDVTPEKVSIFQDIL